MSHCKGLAFLFYEEKCLEASAQSSSSAQELLRGDGQSEMQAELCPSLHSFDGSVH